MVEKQKISWILSECHLVVKISIRVLHTYAILNELLSGMFFHRLCYIQGYDKYAVFS